MTKRYFVMSMLFLCLLILSTPAAAAPLVFSASGANSAAIQATVDNFRAALGGLNPNTAGSKPDGRREINWDGVPVASSDPNSFPGGFFNGSTPGIARGVVFSTPGTGFQVSASSDTATPVKFGYPNLFGVFSAEKLFTPIGSNITEVIFFVPGFTTPAAVSGFGAVFTDVDLPNITQIQFFNIANLSLGTFFVPSETGNETLSFLGVLFGAGEQVSRVRITTGNSALGPLESIPTIDLVVMDDFIFGEPQATPLPGTFLLVGTGLAGFLLRLRFTKK